MTLLDRVTSDGYGIIPDVLSENEIAPLAAELRRSDLPRSRAGIRHAMSNATIAAVSQSPQLLGLAAQILGSGAIPFRATLFAKSPTANWLVVWHQDTALPLKVRCEVPEWGPWSVKEGVVYAHAPATALSEVLALRIHLDDSTADNGPLRVLPATHTLGILSDETLHQLSTEIVPIDCLVPRGGILLMRPLLVHASSKSRSESSRRVLHIEYAARRVIADGLELAIA